MNNTTHDDIYIQYTDKKTHASQNTKNDCRRGNGPITTGRH